MASFEVTLYGQFWVTPEVTGDVAFGAAAGRSGGDHGEIAFGAERIVEALGGHQSHLHKVASFRYDCGIAAGVTGRTEFRLACSAILAPLKGLGGAMEFAELDTTPSGCGV
jgi:hypothetical protein